jgi:hypothetical protein
VKLLTKQGIDPIALSDFRKRGFLAFNPNTYVSKKIFKPESGRQKKIHMTLLQNGMRQQSINYLSFIVHQWFGSGKDIFLKAIEEPSLRPQIMDSLSTNLGRIDKSHWAYKAVSDGNKVTVIDDKELLDFFHNSLATAAPFRAEIDGKERYFYLIVLLW